MLRDKQAAWVAGLDDLRQTVGAYKAAVAAGDDAALLKAAEKLHAQYEGLVKIVRPILKEMEDFHASLYVLYHYQMSPFNLQKASESIRAMQEKMGALNAATLPDRLKAKTEAFTTQRARLAKSLDEVAALARRQGRVEDQGRHRVDAHAVREPRESVLALGHGAPSISRGAPRNGRCPFLQRRTRLSVAIFATPRRLIRRAAVCPTRAPRGSRAPRC